MPACALDAKYYLDDYGVKFDEGESKIIIYKLINGDEECFHEIKDEESVGIIVKEDSGKWYFKLTDDDLSTPFKIKILDLSAPEAKLLIGRRVYPNLNVNPMYNFNKLIPFVAVIGTDDYRYGNYKPIHCFNLTNYQVNIKRENKTYILSGERDTGYDYHPNYMMYVHGHHDQIL